jgi:hypothetical protein
MSTKGVGGVQIIQVHETYNIELNDEDDDRIEPEPDYEPVYTIEQQQQHQNGTTHSTNIYVVEHVAHHYENVNVNENNNQHPTSSSSQRWFDADVIDEYVNHEGTLF